MPTRNSSIIKSKLVSKVKTHFTVNMIKLFGHNIVFIFETLKIVWLGLGNMAKKKNLWFLFFYIQNLISIINHIFFSPSLLLPLTKTTHNRIKSPLEVAWTLSAPVKRFGGSRCFVRYHKLENLIKRNTSHTWHSTSVSGVEIHSSYSNLSRTTAFKQIFQCSSWCS